MAEHDLKIENSKTSSAVVEHLITLSDSDDEIICMRYDPTDTYLACGWGDGTIRIFNVSTGKLAFILGKNASEDSQFPITWLRWRPCSSDMKAKNILVSCSSNGYIYHWHVGSSKLLLKIDPEDNLQYYWIDYSPDGRNFAVGGNDLTIKIFDEHTKSVVDTLASTMDTCGHSSRVFSVKFNQDDPNLLISGGWDNTVLLWDLRVPKWVGSVYGPHVWGDSIDIRDGFILAGSYHNVDNLYLIDMKKMEIIKTIDWFSEGFERSESDYPSALYSWMYSQDGKYIYAGGTSKNEVRIFEYSDSINDYKVVSRISELSEAWLSLDCQNNGYGFAFGSTDGCVRVMTMTE